jgi:hypothetical protein
MVHAYEDDLVHLAPILELQQQQADLVCGFCAFTGLEISLKKVEAISVNGNFHNTPSLVLRDWVWRPHKHFIAAKLKIQTMCRLLTRKAAPPAAKRLVYTLCIKSQVRYPAGLAPWTTLQYQALDNTGGTLPPHIYGLQRTSPPDLIYAPENVGGCGETRISDNAQLQKWKYLLHSVAHLGSQSADVVSELLLRALDAAPTDPTVYCTSLVEWGKGMGLSLTQAPNMALPQPILHFFTRAATLRPRRIYTDGFFTVAAQLLDVLSMSTTELTHAHGQAATEVYLPSYQGREALALIICTPLTNRDGCLLSGAAGHNHLNAPIAVHTPVSLLGLLLCNPQDTAGLLHPGLSGGLPPTWRSPPRPSSTCLPGEVLHDAHVDAIASGKIQAPTQVDR